ncbi:mitogen-activated protein kinase kinase kinase 1-like [Andrographis paniculata]|uniref:mitogen-activated protein kinase kinase kinase 1-like n=1 Tax=Andrographis paniculata TaxID=175694 RepID=UPI0021E8547B|nr:mitogen-activated protein kinase kinase kinase 1-like [Andrographis paniculata]
MHRIPKFFAHSSNRRKGGGNSGSNPLSGKRKPRLERLNAKKNFNYEFFPSSASASSSSSYYSSEDSPPTSSIDLYCGKTSFRVDASGGEIEILCKRLGFSGIDDFAIPVEEYEAMKVKSCSTPIGFSRKIDGLLDRKLDADFDEESGLSSEVDCIDVVDAVSFEIEGNGMYLRLAEISDDMISKCKEGSDSGYIGRNGANNLGSKIVDRRVPSDSMLSDNLVGTVVEVHGNGIKGVRPPVLAPPSPTSFPEIDQERSTWNLFGASVPASELCISRLEYGFCFDEAGCQKRSEDQDPEEDRRERGMARDENCLLSGSCSFTTTSIDDDSSSIMTDPLSSISPDGGYRRIILEWQKGELLGRGSFGSVFEGIADGGFFFAVKEVSLLDQGDAGKQRIIQLEQEIALLSQFKHENIVQYYGTKRDESHLYIFLELVTKGSLLRLYQKYILRDSQVSAYTRQILHGLKYLHDRNVVHRDIKCANILVHTNGLVKLADFGLAKTTKLNDVNSCKGTAFWMAPEVVRSMGYGLAADIWSLGCTVLEMLTRQFPYHNLECMPALFKIGQGERPPVPNSLSSEARDFILKCLQVDPRLRPSAEQLLDHPFVKQPLPSSAYNSPRYFARRI